MCQNLSIIRLIFSCHFTIYLNKTNFPWPVSVWEHIKSAGRWNSARYLNIFLTRLIISIWSVEEIPVAAAGMSTRRARGETRTHSDNFLGVSRGRPAVTSLGSDVCCKKCDNAEIYSQSKRRDIWKKRSWTCHRSRCLSWYTTVRRQILATCYPLCINIVGGMIFAVIVWLGGVVTCNPV